MSASPGYCRLHPDRQHKWWYVNARMECRCGRTREEVDLHERQVAEDAALRREVLALCQCVVARLAPYEGAVDLPNYAARLRDALDRYLVAHPVTRKMDDEGWMS